MTTARTTSPVPAHCDKPACIMGGKPLYGSDFAQEKTEERATTKPKPTSTAKPVRIQARSGTLGGHHHAAGQGCGWASDPFGQSTTTSDMCGSFRTPHSATDRTRPGPAVAAKCPVPVRRGTQRLSAPALTKLRILLLLLRLANVSVCLCQLTVNEVRGNSSVGRNVTSAASRYRPSSR